VASPDFFLEPIPDQSVGKGARWVGVKGDITVRWEVLDAMQNRLEVHCSTDRIENENTTLVVEGRIIVNPDLCLPEFCQYFTSVWHEELYAVTTITKEFIPDDLDVA
jgi:hypothetical protein